MSAMVIVIAQVVKLIGLVAIKPLGNIGVAISKATTFYLNILQNVRMFSIRANSSNFFFIFFN